MGSSVAMYGAYQTERVVRTKQDVWILRRDGINQRYWKWINIRIVTEARGRYEFYGKERDLYHAIRMATKHPPDGYVDVEARDFMENPYDYCVSGEWIWYEIES